MDIVPWQLKVKNFYYEIQDYNNGDDIIYIEKSYDGFLRQWKKYGIRLLNY